MLSALPVLSLLCFCLVLACPVQAGVEDVPATHLVLRVDDRHHARAFCNGFKSPVSIGGSFEFFERSMARKRVRIFSGPWSGRLRAQGFGGYSLSGDDRETGTEYTISFAQADEQAVELRLSFLSPARTSVLEFEVAKLEADLFKGAEIIVDPGASADARDVPIEPRSQRDRMLLSGKSRILFRGGFCDIEIRDMTGGKILYAADGRNLPWDRQKSIGIGAVTQELAPSSRREFRFQIRAFPPSRTLPDGPGPSGFPTPVADDPRPFFEIKPKHEVRRPGAFRLTAGDVIFGRAGGTAEAILSRDLERMAQLRLPVKSNPNAAPPTRGISLERVSRDRLALPPEGFEIVVKPDGVTVRAADERGCLFGIYALLGRLVQNGSGWEIGCVEVRDWPDLPLRGVCMEQLIPALLDIGIVKRYLEAHSRARGNTVIFLHDPRHLRAWLERRDDGRWTRDQMREIVEHARWLHLDVWGGVGSGFRSRDFPEMEIHPASTFYNPAREDNYRYLFRLYETLLETYRPAVMLIGRDEIQGLSVYADMSGTSTAKILVDDVQRVRAWLAGKNIRTAMWGDMLLDHERWESRVGSANSRNPSFRSGATHPALLQLPRDIFILDWHYDLRESYASIEHFRSKGFEVAGASWYEPLAAKTLTESVKRFGGQGVVATDFGFLRTFSPAATTLYAQLCAWSSRCRIDDTLAIRAFAESLRDQRTAGPAPRWHYVDLTPFANRTMRAYGSPASRGIFDVGPFLDLRAFKTGRHMLGGALFDVAPDDGGQTNNAVVVTNAPALDGSPPKSATVFQGEARALQIAFLQTAFIMEPVRDVRRIGRYRIAYSDGTQETAEIMENWNITDIRSSEGLRWNAWTFQHGPDVLLGARRAWQGSSVTGIPLNVQAYIWSNPHPNKFIRSISLFADDSPKGVRLALLGLTLLTP